MNRPHLDPSRYVSGEKLASLCDEAYWIPGGRREANPAVLQARDCTVIYSHTDQVFGLFDTLRMKRGRYIVVTAESDHAVSEQDFQARPWNVTEWFGVNATADHPSCHVLPLGLANETCRLTLKPAAIAGFDTPAEKTSWLYVNHRIETNPAVRGPVYELFNRVRAEGWVTIEEPRPAGEMGNYLDELNRHRFVCCPPGNGIDTHRMWEALYVGTIPIVLRSRVTDAFADLPILQVGSYAEVTLPFLEEKYRELLQKSVSWKKLDLAYWSDQLQAARRRAGSVSRASLLWRWLLRKAGSRN